ncbi:MAG TPA: hypothetical protein VF062_14895 [Candidatus Limnocylindrales bacterium]
MFVALVTQVVAAPTASSTTLDEWLTYPCGSGTLNLAAADYEDVDGFAIRVEMPGTLACSAGNEFRFAVAVFAPGTTQALVPDGMLGGYAASGTTAFTLSVAVTTQQQLGLCLMPDPETRLSCALVSSDAAGAVTVTSLDPATTKVTAELSSIAVQPECNTCWSIEA